MTREPQAQAGMLCPACRVPLVMSERQNIEIDYCPQCRGIWLDRGELDKIVERSLSQAAPAAQAPGREPYGREGYEGRGHGKHGYGKHGYRRKSWLQELFD